MAAIVASDIVWRYSVKTGSAGNTTASSAAASLGTYISTTVVATSGGNELFPDITGAQNAASQVDYVGVVVYNSNTANSYQSAVVYLSSEVAGGASIAVAADSTATSALGSSSAQMLTATSSTAPGGSITGLTYSSPTTAATGVALSSIPATQVKGFWVRRTAANTAALSGDGVTLATSGDTGSL
jgi:hypothetical protein